MANAPAAFPDALDDRVQHWIAEQYNFALSEHAADDAPSLRDSHVLPADFDPFIVPLDASNALPEQPRDLDDAMQLLVHEMNARRGPTNRDKPLPRAPPASPTSFDFPSPPASPRSPTFRKRPSLPTLAAVPAPEAPEGDSSEHALMTSASYASLRSRAYSQCGPPSPTSRSRKRDTRFPSISTTLSVPPPTPVIPQHAFPPSLPPNPTTPTTPTSHTYSTPPLTHGSSPSTTPSQLSSTPSQIHLPSLNTKPSLPSLASRPSFLVEDDAPPSHLRSDTFLRPQHPVAEASRWSVATSAQDIPAHKRSGSNPRKVIPAVKAKKEKESKSLRKRIMSTFGISPKKSSPSSSTSSSTPTSSFPPTPNTASTFNFPSVPSHVLSPSSPSNDVVPLAFAPNPDPDPFAAQSQSHYREQDSDDYTAFLARMPRSPTGAGQVLDSDASFITNSYISVTAPFSPALPLPPIPTSPLADEFGASSPAFEQDETVRASPKSKAKKANRMSWASTKSRTVRRLVVSGLARAPGAREGKVAVDVDAESMNDQELAVRSWCEAFGEIRRITRTPAGALVVEWKRSTVADTVCRLQARVHIQGVGSVALSWVEGRRKVF